MKLPRGIDVGTATHTGWVRAANEDDFLIGTAPAAADGSLVLCAVADGMGGVAGGAEASRIALRGLGSTVLDGTAGASIAQRFERGFAAASERVFAESSAVPALRDMGTTLTAVCIAESRVRIGHVGDTRAYRCRNGRCQQLTTDHAVREPENLLLRCIGGGKAHSEVDLDELTIVPGDRFVLVTDGVWSTMPAAQFARLAVRGDAQGAAEALVAAALEAGGPDNATAVVVDVADTRVRGVHEVDLPRDERPSSRSLWPRPFSLRPPIWPWALWAAAAVLLGGVLAQTIWGGDLLPWLN